MPKKVDGENDGSKPNYHSTREGWLDQLVVLLRPHFEACGHPLPEKIRTGIGYGPQGSGVKRLGGNLPAEASTGDNVETWVRPELEDPIEVAVALVAELVSAVLPPGAGRGAAYRTIAIEVGLKGQMREPHASERLRGCLNAILAEIGPLKHDAVKSDYKLPKRIRKPQKSRSLTAVCPACKGKIWFSSGLLRLGGLPTCTDDQVLFVIQTLEGIPETGGTREDDKASADGGSTEASSHLAAPLAPSVGDVDSSRLPSPDPSPDAGRWIAWFPSHPSTEIRVLLKAQGRFSPTTKQWEGKCTAETEILQKAVLNEGGNIRLGVPVIEASHTSAPHLL